MYLHEKRAKKSSASSSSPSLGSSGPISVSLGNRAMIAQFTPTPLNSSGMPIQCLMSLDTFRQQSRLMFGRGERRHIGPVDQELDAYHQEFGFDQLSLNTFNLKYPIINHTAAETQQRKTACQNLIARLEGLKSAIDAYDGKRMVRGLRTEVLTELQTAGEILAAINGESPLADLNERIQSSVSRDQLERLRAAEHDISQLTALNQAYQTAHGAAYLDSGDLAQQANQISQRIRQMEQIYESFVEFSPHSTLAMVNHAIVDSRSDPAARNHEAQAQGMYDRLTRISPHIVESLNAQDAKVRLAEHKVATENKAVNFMPLAGRPNGQTWRSTKVPGAYLPPEIVKFGPRKRALAKVGKSAFGQNHGGINLELHETGHMVDYELLSTDAECAKIAAAYHGLAVPAKKTRISSLPNFQALHASEKGSLFPASYGGSTYYDTITEYFAECFAMYHTTELVPYGYLGLTDPAVTGASAKDYLNRHAPNTFQFFETLDQIR